jgi:DNA-binding protein H-NS
MAKASLASMSFDTLVKLRDDVTDVIGRRATELRKQLESLGDWGSSGRKTASKKAARKARGSKLKGRKVAPKYRNPKTGETWSGRGAMAGWMTAAIKAGKKKDSFLIAKPARRKAKR